jgi:AcrR family transcriptional regulator
MARMPDRSAPAASRLQRRRQRERDILDSTRAAFDGRGMQDAPMDEIARAAGINRALIYRHFDSKDDLFVLTMTTYLNEITERGRRCIDPDESPQEQLRASWASFTDYCLEYPAFLDCAISLMRGPAERLRLSLTETTWLRLGRSMSDCLAVTIDILDAGVRDGAFELEDTARTVNYLYAQTIGLLHTARLGVGVAHTADGSPTLFSITPAEIRDACVRIALSAVGCERPGAQKTTARR